MQLPPLLLLLAGAVSAIPAGTSLPVLTVPGGGPAITASLPVITPPSKTNRLLRKALLLHPHNHHHPKGLRHRLPRAQRPHHVPGLHQDRAKGGPLPRRLLPQDVHPNRHRPLPQVRNRMRDPHHHRVHHYRLRADSHRSVPHGDFDQAKLS
ncbi:uncharacterized protein PODANS_6_9820 [Podospora anserina S mat+]|uniref:Podospora anserina S mat+ genomic DNA chromosome 6, supercontig 4 n=1 Tax=Podospora anserina (strain S / ATCC MYA-4624 / DSM 980 / FGSC 10383) TaxID=515849 RepID=B2ANR3_PODAN|nr:uncharacterized protein PODANS_6_9820 [Podospora anserina S mat+]CAP65485.1 unnamed protein product [Podospora anserina S mat+]